MKATERANKHNRRDWIIILLILLFGFFCIITASGWALRFAPNWELNANAESLIDPNSDFLTKKPDGFYEPVDLAILTNANWVDLYLTPGALIPANVQLQTLESGASSITSGMTGTSITTQTITPTTSPIATSTVIASATSTPTLLPSATNTFIYIPPTSTKTQKPAPPPASTSTDTSTPTDTATTTATFTPTFTPTATLPASCTTIVTLTGTSGSYPNSSGSTCFQYTDPTFVNGGVFQITSTGVTGQVDGNGSGCTGKHINDGNTLSFGAAQSGGVMIFRITGTAGTVDITVSDWVTYPTCP